MYIIHVPQSKKLAKSSYWSPVYQLVVLNCLPILFGGKDSLLGVASKSFGGMTGQAGWLHLNLTRLDPIITWLNDQA